MTTRFFSAILLLGVLTSAHAQQHSARPVKPPDTGPVSVTRSATLQVFVASDVVSIFSYLTDQKRLILWFSDQAILEPQFGGKYHLRWKNNEAVDGVITEYLAANTVALTWKHPNEEAETQVRFKLSPQGERTLVQVEHLGFATAGDLDKAVDFWVFYLKNLKSVIEAQEDLRPTVAKTPARPAVHTRPK